jgi:hypothetical protein
VKHAFIRYTILGCAAACSLPALASGCPFDTPSASITREGLVLTRYARGYAGGALVANSGFAATDAPTIQSNIVALNDQLDINRSGGFDITDATIISRKIAGFSNAAATSGIPAANLGPGGASAVNSFLLSGCGNTAFVQGGNTFGAPAVLGTNDAQSLTLRSGGTAFNALLPGGRGIRMRDSSAASPDSPDSINVISGSSVNAIEPAAYGATIAGGGTSVVSSECDVVGGICRNQVERPFGTVSGGYGNRAGGTSATVAGGAVNWAAAGQSTIGGGEKNTASGEASTVGGGYKNVASSITATVGGGFINSASGSDATVGGGAYNNATAEVATVPGGIHNTASGNASFAAGRYANASHSNSFVLGGWSGASSIARVNSIGPETFTAYFPSGYYLFAGPNGSGRGCIINGQTGAGIACTSDRDLKSNIARMNPRDMLKRVANLPVFHWSFKGEEKIRSAGPMAQDFHAAFGLGGSDKYLSAADMSGVALAAIQGLNQKLLTQIKTKNDEIVSLKSRLDAIERKLAGHDSKR